MQIKAPGNEINYLLQQTRVHHMQLSSMADLKANMLLTMSSIIITLAVPRVLVEGKLQWPLVMLIVFSLITILLAAYSVMPKLPFWSRKKTAAAPDAKSSHFNLLFFGDFSGMDYSHFVAEMEAAMNEPSRVYELQVREIYILGNFLAHTKYRYLRLAYFTFICGLLTSVVALVGTNLR
ncbi:MAG TPA: Pycsar system effector family protein [Lacunisphaera sp.]|jgi:hypothetical protein